MSCQNTSTCSCPCPPTNGTRSGSCPDTGFKCPVVCSSSVPKVEELPANVCLWLQLISVAISYAEEPSQLCGGCDPEAEGQIICVDRCSVPFTGQTVTIVTIDLGATEPVCQQSECGLGKVTLKIYEKCGTYWFKIPNNIFLDPCYALDYPADFGSVSITKPSTCPETWQGRVLIDGFCYPITFQLTNKSELISKCTCPPYLDYTHDIKVESTFQKYMSTQQIQCVSASTLFILSISNIVAQIQLIYQSYIFTKLDAVAKACGCVDCNIGNDCSAAGGSCPYGTGPGAL